VTSNSDALLAARECDDTKYSIIQAFSQAFQPEVIYIGQPTGAHKQQVSHTARQHTKVNTKVNASRKMAMVLMAKTLDMARPLDATRLMFLAIARLAELVWMAACCIAIVGLTWYKLLDIAIEPTIAKPTIAKVLDMARVLDAARLMARARPLDSARLMFLAIARLTWIVAWCIVTAMRSKWLIPCWHQFVTMASVYDARLIRNCEARLACLLASHIMYTNE